MVPRKPDFDLEHEKFTTGRADHDVGQRRDAVDFIVDDDLARHRRPALRFAQLYKLARERMLHRGARA